MANKKTSILFLAPVLVSLILHFHVFNLDLIGYHVWRQTQTQATVYLFSNSDNSILHPQRFDLNKGTTELLYEFPLYQWLIAQTNNIFGYSVMHTRIISFIFFVLFLAAFYKLISMFVSNKTALIINALICFSPLLYYYCVNPLPDIFGLALAIWALFFFFKHIKTKTGFYFILFCVFISLAGLVKLPFFLFGTVYFLYAFKEIKRGEYRLILKEVIIGIICMIPLICWYIKAVPTWSGNNITSGILGNTKSWIVLFDYFQFTVISSVPELITNYASCIFLVSGIYFFFKNRNITWKKYEYFVWLFIVFSIYYLFEMNMIEKTHDYYLLPFVPLVFLVVGYGVNYFYQTKRFKFLTLVVCLVPLTAWLRIDQRWNKKAPGFELAYLVKQKEIKALIPEKGICVIDHDDSKFIALYYLKRNGYSLDENQLNDAELKRLYAKGARYLVSTNENFNVESFGNFNMNLLFNEGLKIYQLNLK